VEGDEDLSRGGEQIEPCENYHVGDDPWARGSHGS
jgi:hypothetical protein